MKKERLNEEVKETLMILFLVVVCVILVYIFLTKLNKLTEIYKEGEAVFKKVKAQTIQENQENILCAEKWIDEKKYDADFIYSVKYDTLFETVQNEYDTLNIVFSDDIPKDIIPFIKYGVGESDKNDFGIIRDLNYMALTTETFYNGNLIGSFITNENTELIYNVYVCKNTGDILVFSMDRQ